MASEWVVAIATVFLVFLTGLYVWLTFQLLAKQTEASIVVYVQQNGHQPSIFEIAIENIGRGLAEELSFELSEPLSIQTIDSLHVHEWQFKDMKHGPLIEGIPALAP